MSETYANIGAADENSACLTDSNGNDVAWLTRVMRSDVPPTYTTLTDDEWQQTINLISLAPQMLLALQRLAHPMADDEDLDYAREIIRKAKGQQ